MTLTRLSMSLLVAAAAFTSAQAQELRYGVQAHVSLPLGDLKDVVDNKPGIGGGVHMTVDFGQGHVLRPRLDYLAFPNATISTVRNKVNELSLGVDYLYMMEGNTGFYLTGGLAANRWSVQTDVSGLDSFSSNTTKLGYALGAGYAFNENLGLEARFTATKFDTRAVSDQNANALQLVASYRF